MTVVVIGWVRASPACARAGRCGSGNEGSWCRANENLGVRSLVLRRGLGSTAGAAHGALPGLRPGAPRLATARAGGGGTDQSPGGGCDTRKRGRPSAIVVTPMGRRNRLIEIPRLEGDHRDPVGPGRGVLATGRLTRTARDHLEWLRRQTPL